VQQAPEGQADPLIRPLFSAYNGLACRLGDPEQERARREGRRRDEVRTATRALHAMMRDGRLQIRVVDRGPGFPSPLLESPAPVGSWHSSGNGLGLATVRRFARRLFGELRLANPEAGGALAIIDLPGQRGGKEQRLSPYPFPGLPLEIIQHPELSCERHPRRPLAPGPVRHRVPGGACHRQ
jgi:hypothetical protein